MSLSLVVSRILMGAQDYICYAISLYISGNYSSPVRTSFSGSDFFRLTFTQAKTATHIHEAPVGRAGEFCCLSSGPSSRSFPPPLPCDVCAPSTAQS